MGKDTKLATQVLQGLGYDDILDCVEILRKKCLLEYHLDVKSNDESKCTPEKPVRIIYVFNICPAKRRGLGGFLLPLIVCFSQIGDYYNFYLPHPRGRYKIAMHD